MVSKACAHDANLQAKMGKKKELTMRIALIFSVYLHLAGFLALPSSPWASRGTAAMACEQQRGCFFDYEKVQCHCPRPQPKQPAPPPPKGKK